MCLLSLSTLVSHSFSVIDGSVREGERAYASPEVFVCRLKDAISGVLLALCDALSFE